MKRAFVFAVLLTTLGSTLVAAETYKIDPGHSEATFQVRHLMSKVTGRFSEFNGTILVDRQKPQASSVEFTMKSASVDTNNADRDKHLRSGEFFDAEKHPEIRFKSSTIKSVGKDAFDVSGPLTIKGITKLVTVRVNYLGVLKDPWGNEKAGFEVTTKLNRKDFGIIWNRALDNGGYLLDDDVLVAINLEAVKEKAEPAVGR